jgi:PAS domain S-box-containing protein
MADTARSAKAAALRRDAILEAVAYAAERFLLAPDWREAADEVLARLGAAANVSRAYVIENVRGDGGRDLCVQRAEWCAPGVASQAGNPILEGLAWEESGFGRWPARMRRGDVIAGVVDGFPPGERDALRAQDIVSIASLPVFVADEWWGLVGFDDCVRARDWASAEIDALRAAASLLGAAISRQRQDLQLREAERRYRAVVENMPAVTYIERPAGDDASGIDLAYISPQVEALLGYAPEDWIGRPGFWESIVHPDDRAAVAEAAAAGHERGGTTAVEYRMVARDGRTIWVRDEAVLVRDADGRPLFWQGFFVDITQRKEAELRTIEAENRYRLLIERMPAITYTELLDESGRYDPRTTVAYASPQIASLLGYSPEEWSRPGFWMKAVHPDDLPAVLEESDRVVRAGEETYGQDYRLVARDGSVLWFHDESNLVRDSEGRPLMWQGIMIEITERKRAEENLRRTEERFRLLVEKTPAIVYQEAPSATGDTVDSVVYVSPQVERILGYAPEVWSARPGAWHGLIHPEDRERVLSEDARVTETGEPYRQEYRMIAADGRVVWFHDEAVLVTGDDGEPVWQGVMVDITERKEAEQRLREAEERNRALVENVPAVVYVEAPDGDPERFYIGPQVEGVFGYSAREWAWTPDFWADHVHPDDRERILEADALANATKEPFREEYRFLAADGTYRWISDEATYLEGPPGEEGFWQGFIVDITERKEAEERLREAEERFRSLVEQSPAMIYVQEIDPATGVSTTSYISPVNEDLIGYGVEEVRADPSLWTKIIHPDDRERVLAADIESNAGAEEFSMEYRMIHRDGHVVWVHDTARLIRIGDRPPLWQGFLLDVTERKLAEEALQESLEHVRLIVDTALDAVITMDRDGRIRGWNPQAEATFGWSADDVIGRALADTVIPPEVRDQHRRGLARFLETGEGPVLNRRIEVEALHRDGHRFPAELSIVPVKTAAGTMFSGFVRDITERRRAQEDLERALELEREATRQLRELDEMKNTFLQAVSHDLRTPLAAILGLAVTLERGEVPLEAHETQDLARRIAGNARKLDRLVTNLLDMDRLARGIVTPKLAPTDVGALVRRLLAETQALGDRRSQTDVHPVVVSVDAAKVERIVENLLANAARYAPEDATVWVSVRAHDGGVLILVEDDGPGIPPELREEIFEPFRQGPDAPRHSPGVGVGLTLVRRFAELHGGRAWVQERRGGGASFRVFLPDGAASG